MEALFIDTHAIIWLYNGESEKFSPHSKARLDAAEERLVSPVSILEIDYLHEIGRITEGGAVMLDDLRVRAALEVPTDSFDDIVRKASGLTWTRDLFDRLLVGHAVLHKASLLTKDRSIRKHYSKAVW